MHTLPAVAALRDANPDAKITWVINPEWSTLLRGNPDVDHIHLFPRSEFRGLRGPFRLLPWLAKTRKLQPDVAFDFQGLLRSAWIGKLSRAKRMIGLSDAREGSRWFYQEIAQVNRTDHAVERYLKMAENFGAPITRPLRFPIPTGDALQRFDDQPSFVLLHPFARGSSKSLSDLVIEEFCRRLAPMRVVVVGKRKRSFSPPENCLDLVNQTTLLELIFLLRAAEFVVSVDSGPMHIAAAVNDRLLSIHTWTDPRRVGPYNPKAWIWKNGELLRSSDLADAGDKLKKSRAFGRADLDKVVALISSADGSVREA